MEDVSGGGFLDERREWRLAVLKPVARIVSVRLKGAMTAAAASFLLTLKSLM